jgi:hypothetical protein
MSVLPVVRAVLNELDPLIPIAEARPLHEVWRASMAREGSSSLCSLRSASSHCCSRRSASTASPRRPHAGAHASSASASPSAPAAPTSYG